MYYCLHTTIKKPIKETFPKSNFSILLPGMYIIVFSFEQKIPCHVWGNGANQGCSFQVFFTCNNLYTWACLAVWPGSLSPEQCLLTSVGRPWNMTEQNSVYSLLMIHCVYINHLWSTRSGYVKPHLFMLFKNFWKETTRFYFITLEERPITNLIPSLPD